MSGTTKSHPAFPLPTLELDEKQKARDTWGSVTAKASWKLCLRCAAAKDCLESVSLTLSALPQPGRLVSGKLTCGQRADGNAPAVGRQRGKRGRVEAGHAQDFFPTPPAH